MVTLVGPFEYWSGFKMISKMVGKDHMNAVKNSLVFRWYLDMEPFNYLTHLSHLNTGLVRYSCHHPVTFIITIM